MPYKSTTINAIYHIDCAGGCCHAGRTSSEWEEAYSGRAKARRRKSNSLFLIIHSQILNLLFRQFGYQYNFIDGLSHFQQGMCNFQFAF